MEITLIRLQNHSEKYSAEKKYNIRENDSFIFAKYASYIVENRLCFCMCDQSYLFSLFEIPQVQHKMSK